MPKKRHPKAVKTAKAKPRRKPKAKRSPGDAHRERETRRQREYSATSREAGPLPAVVDQARKDRGRVSLLAFCREYFPRRFTLPFGPPHLTAISRMERCTDVGGKFACGMPRSQGKTTLAEVAVLRAMVYGLRRFTVLVCATQPLARRRLKQILRELETNDLLLADFPEACHLVRRLERIHNRTAGQTLNGIPTRIEMTADSLILPTVPGAASSGAIVQVFGMEGAIRGLNVSGPDGQPLRPDCVVLDDVQTRDSARSLAQTVDREAVVDDDIMGLAGPETELAAVLLATVIYPGDLSDRFLSPERHPEWQGVRTKMLETFPERMDLWERYKEIRDESFRSGDEGRRGNEFLLANWDEMHKGGVVSWPERKKKGELSGLQSAMNLYLSNPRGFRSEYQCDPEPEGGMIFAKEHRPDRLVSRLSGVPRLDVPREAVRVTAGIDCGAALHWYALVAWDGVGGGSVIDYGAWPRQARRVFEAIDPRPSLSEAYPHRPESAVVFAGLSDLVNAICGRVYRRDVTGEELRVERCLVDVGWQAQAVHQYVRATNHPGIIYPAKGIGRTLTARGVSEWKPRAGERSGWHWRLTMSETGRGRMVQHDPDAWKSFLFERLTSEMGTRGAMTFYGLDELAHEMIASHVAAEAAEPVTLRGAMFDKWSVRPHRPDNHLLDTLVLAAVAASVQGMVWSASDEPPSAPSPRRRLTLGEKMKLKGEPRVIDTGGYQ